MQEAPLPFEYFQRKTTTTTDKMENKKEGKQEEGNEDGGDGSSSSSSKSDVVYERVQGFVHQGMHKGAIGMLDYYGLRY